MLRAPTLSRNLSPVLRTYATSSSSHIPPSNRSWLGTSTNPDDPHGTKMFIGGEWVGAERRTEGGYEVRDPVSLDMECLNSRCFGCFVVGTRIVMWCNDREDAGPSHSQRGSFLPGKPAAQTTPLLRSSARRSSCVSAQSRRNSAAGHCNRRPGEVVRRDHGSMRA
jgi:hypothetical protein